VGPLGCPMQLEPALRCKLGGAEAVAKFGPLCSPFPLQPAAPGCPLAPALALGVINGPLELVPGQLGLLEPPCHLGRAALFHLVIYRARPLPPHPALGTEEPARLCKVPSPVPCAAPGISRVLGASHPSPGDKGVPRTSSWKWPSAELGRPSQSPRTPS